MIRLVFVIIMMLISGIIYLIKAAAGKVTGKEVSFQDESKKVMEKTARGLHWMTDQWEKAKGKAGGNNQLSPELLNLSATQIILKVKGNPLKYDTLNADQIYIAAAIYKMNNRQFDDAHKLVMQLPDNEERQFIINEIAQQRHL